MRTVSEKSLFEVEVLYLEPFQKPIIELLGNNYFFWHVTSIADVAQGPVYASAGTSRKFLWYDSSDIITNRYDIIGNDCEVLDNY